MTTQGRAPSPDPDAVQYLSIYYPFPLYVNFEEEKERPLCARWLACFIDRENLHAIFYKPSSENTIIIEIRDGLSDMKMRKILGLHDWDEVFVTYDKKEGITNSKVFYSTFGSREEVKNDGWKIVEVQDKWFERFDPTRGSKVKYPYPATTFCELPNLAGEVTARSLFRALPANLFPEGGKQPDVTGTASAIIAPQPRVIPGSGGVFARSSNAGGKGKKKDNGSGNAGIDPAIRQTAPLARLAEASAKAKAIHNQPAKMTFKSYEEDSDDDDVGYYRSQTDDFGPAASTSEYNPFFFNGPAQDDDAERCPTHGKRCPKGACSWAVEQKRLQRQRENRTGGTAGQNERYW